MSKPARPPPLIIAVIGDFGVKSVHSYAVAQLVRGWDPAFVITTGDNLYSTPTVKNYKSTIGALYGKYLQKTETDSDTRAANPEPDPVESASRCKLRMVTNGDASDSDSIPLPPSHRFFPCVGNHDFPFGPYCDFFNLPTYYGIHCEHADFGDNLLRLYSINDYMETDGSFNTPGSIQCKWLTHELQQAQEAGCTWIIAYFHHPIIWSSRTNVKRTGKRPPPRFPFEQYGLALIFCGHHHFYERIQLATAADATSPLQQVIVGTGGHSLRPGPTRGQGGRVPASVVLDDSGYGALKLEVSDRELKAMYCVVQSPDQENTNRKKGGRLQVRVVDEFSISRLPRRK